MKPIITAIILFASILFVSCEAKDGEAQKLSIQINKTQILIHNDSSENIFIHSKLRTAFNLTKLEKLRFFSLAEKALKRKSYTIKTKTDFAGQNFKIELVKMRDTLKIENSSVNKWTEIHPEFEEINNILSKKNLIIE